jgi:YbbR domain-containing protein
MKEKLTRNISLKILSLLLAVFLWVVILNVDDPVITDTIRNIEVTKVNEKALESKDKIYEVVSGDTVDVKVKGKRSVIEKLRPTDFQAIADLSQLSVVYAVPIDVLPVTRYRDDVEIIKQETTTMKVSLENLVGQDFRIDVVEKGTVAEGYYLSEKKTSPNMIQVSGAESVINKISKVIVEVDVSNMHNSNNTLTAVPKVYDKNGTLMDTSNLTLSYDEVVVSIMLVPTKKVRLDIKLTGTPFDGYEYVEFKYDPLYVMIAGEQEVLDKVPYISGNYNIDNKRESFDDQINIVDLITEDDIILIDENQVALLVVTIEPMETKELNYNASEIDIRNIPEGFNATVNNDSTIRITVYGDEEELASVNKYNLNPFIDLTGSEVGTRLMNIQFEPSINNISIKNQSISITVSDSLE